MENMMTPADIAAVTRDDHRDGFFGEGGFFWIVVLFLIFGMMGGGGFGWGNNAATHGAITRGELYEGFNTSAILQNQNGLMRDNFGLQRDILENRFTAQKCCCDTQKDILESRYTTQLGSRRSRHSRRSVAATSKLQSTPRLRPPGSSSTRIRCRNCATTCRRHSSNWATCRRRRRSSTRCAHARSRHIHLAAPTRLRTGDITDATTAAAAADASPDRADISGGDLSPPLT